MYKRDISSVDNSLSERFSDFCSEIAASEKGFHIQNPVRIIRVHESPGYKLTIQLKPDSGTPLYIPFYGVKASAAAISIKVIYYRSIFETLVLLSKKKPDSHIVVDVEFGEGEGKISLKDALKRAEGRKPKSKTTYKDIQNYVEENYGFKVHTAYIAEVKRNLGLPMYDAPNAVEELKRPRSHPTEKMVLAIKETLAHFEII